MDINIHVKTKISQIMIKCNSLEGKREKMSVQFTDVSYVLCHNNTNERGKKKKCNHSVCLTHSLTLNYTTKGTVK